MSYSLTRDAGEQGHDGKFPSPVHFQKEGKGDGRAFFIISPYVFSWFIKIKLKQICYSYLRSQKIYNIF